MCFEARGAPGDPVVLLIAGAASSMDLWEDELCALIAARGRRVVRYDHRDTGRSTTYPPRAPGYGALDLLTDAVAVLDAVGVARAHVAGMSMGGGLAQELALHHPDRVATLTLISTTSIAPDRDDLPGMTDELRATFADPPPAPDWQDRDAVVAHLIATERPYARSFDEARARARAQRVADRSADPAAAANHWQLGGEGLGGRPAEIDVPTLVVHGTADPLFPLAHGRALAAQIPGARLLELDGVGHEPPPPAAWPAFVAALVTHIGPSG